MSEHFGVHVRGGKVKCKEPTKMFIPSLFSILAFSLSLVVASLWQKVVDEWIDKQREHHEDPYPHLIKYAIIVTVVSVGIIVLLAHWLKKSRSFK